ncbi:heme exporter protein CcmB [Thalassospira lucentensis]|uniref:heme exporter protein CcmB n=1 Tax=Thalassospira lucentensis TaxID=168935 RepID=UPI003D281248
MNGFTAILRRDLRLAMRQGADSVMVVAFFIVTTTLFPFGVGPEANILARIASGVIWVSALLAAMLSLERVFQTDYEDGTLELLTLSPVSLEVVVLGKVVAHWLTTGLPLIVAAPLMAVMLNMDTDGFVVLMIAMLLGTPALSLIGAIGAALILGARRGGVLVSLLVLPLYIPILIFGAGAVEAALLGMSATAQLQIMGAVLLLALAATPFATAHALRQAME